MAKKSKFQIRVEYMAVRVLLGFLGILPRRISIAAAQLVAVFLYHILGGLRRVGMKNLSIAFPEKIEEDRERILKGTFRSLGRTLGEMSHFHRISREKLADIVDFELDEQAKDLYRAVKEEGKGVLITTGHLGNWELLVFAFAALYQPIAYLARPLDNPLIEDLTVRIRTRFGNRPLNKTNSAMTAIKLLRGGEILGVLADVNAHPKEGVFVPFFGVDACTSSGPAMMALRTGAVVFPVFCVFDEAKGKYKFVHGSVIEPEVTGDRERDVATLTAAYTAEIEKIIRAWPEQWLWIHKRWKTRPNGEAKIY